MTKVLTPTDRGLAFINDNANGTVDVYVALAAREGSPEDVVAMHFNRRQVLIDSGVETVPAASGTRTARPVNVYADAAGDVHVQARRVKAARVPGGDS